MYFDKQKMMHPTTFVLLTTDENFSSDYKPLWKIIPQLILLNSNFIYFLFQKADNDDDESDDEDYEDVEGEGKFKWMETLCGKSI